MKNMMHSNDDCYKCCLAEYFNIPYNEIPDFFGYEIEKKLSYYEIFLRLDEWLKKRGFIRVYIPTNKVPNSSGKMKCIGFFRKKINNYDHATILKTDNGTTWSCDDPKMDSNYEWDYLCGVEVFIPYIS